MAKRIDFIKHILIDDLGRLCIFPLHETFEFIWKQAAEVGWDYKGSFLHSPVPREWSYFDWYRQIIMVVENEYGCSLLLHDQTGWGNLPDQLKKEIVSYHN